MRLMKMFGLAAMAAVAAMAFLGASSASATFDTSLCKVLEGLACPPSQQWKEGETIHLIGSGTLLSTLNVLCLTVLGNLRVEGASLAEAPQGLRVKGEFSYNGCGSTAAHNNCEVVELHEYLFDILKTDQHKGVGTGLAGFISLHCLNVLGFITIDCEVDASELSPELGATNLHVTFDDQPLHKTGGGTLCPDEELVDALLETLETTPAHVTS